MCDLSRPAIRKIALELVEFTLIELGEALGVSTYKERRRVASAIRDLVHRAHVEKTVSGTYRYKGHMLNTPKMKMWRAMLVKVRFTREDIVKLSGAKRSAAERFFLSLRRGQVIAYVSGGGYENGLYRLIDPDGAPLEPPVNICQTAKKKGGEVIGRCAEQVEVGILPEAEQGDS